MAFPTVQARNANASSANATTLTAALPASIAKDDLLIAVVARDGTGAMTWGSGFAGWNVLLDANDTGTAACKLVVLYKVADGTESGNLSLVSPSESWCARTWRITGYDPNTPPAIATAGDGGTGSANPDPPSLNPADWGTEDTLWIATSAGDGDVAYTAAPASYGNSQFSKSTEATTTDRCALGSAERTLNAASEDPGVFTRATDDWIAATIGVRPAPTAHPITFLRSQTFYKAAATTQDVTINIDAGTARNLVVAVGCELGTGVTVNSVVLDPAGVNTSLSLVSDGVTSADFIQDTTGRVAIWRLLDASLPAAGTYTLRVTLSASAETTITSMLIAGASQAANVDSVDTAGSTSATSISTTPSVATDNSMVLSFSYGNNEPAYTAYTIAGFNAMARGSCEFPSGLAHFMVVAKGLTTESGSQTVTATAAVARRWAMATIVIPPLASGAMVGSASISLAPTGTASGAGALVGSASVSLAPTGTLIDSTPPPGINYVASGSASWASNAITLADPGPAGNLLIAVISHTSGALNNWTPPSGWVAIDSKLVSFNGRQLMAWYKASATGGGATYAFADTDFAGLGSGVILSYSGAAASPFDVNGATVNSTGVTSPWGISAPSVSPVGANDLLVHVGIPDPSFFMAGTITFTAPSGYTKRIGYASSDQRDAIIVSDKTLSASGATGSATATVQDSTNSANAGTIGFHITFKAAATGAISGTASISLSPSATLQGAGALAGSVTATLTPSATATGAAAANGSASISISPAATAQGTANAVGAATVSLSPSGTILAAGALVGAATATLVPAGTLTGAGILAGAGTLSLAPAGTLGGIGALVGSSSITLSPSATADLPTGALAGTATISLAPSGTMTGAGALAGAGTLSLSPSAILGGSATVAGSASISLSPSATGFLRMDGQGSASMSLAPSGTLAGVGALVGSAAVSLAPSATAQGAGVLAGAASITLAPSGTLASGAISGTASISLSASATIRADGALAGSGSVTLSPAATPAGTGTLTGSTAVTLSASATLNGSGNLAGSTTIALTASATGALTVAASGSASISLAPSATLKGTAAAIGAATIALSVTGTFAIIDYGYRPPFLAKLDSPVESKIIVNSVTLLANVDSSVESKVAVDLATRGIAVNETFNEMQAET